MNKIVAAVKSHAPRERVSWNMIYSSFLFFYIVTLHVSVWVEMRISLWRRWRWWSRSTWACELKSSYSVVTLQPSSHAPRERVSWNLCHKCHTFIIDVTLHVSVWVEIARAASLVSNISSSRSTWACELKFLYRLLPSHIPSHAPRERVSWNLL